ncbi:LysE family translocator [Nisaea nitritireducens]|uniref:LysE family translocator n=1 Tax=Nisaea nitritireducens TaxID=568392 RepID=UPI001867FB85|nr:LysE family translocator [Nisaea nitritireducens]
MSAASALTLFFVLAAMAALPSSSVALVVARSAMSGVRHGLAVAAGIVTGDLIFMTMAILSMAALASQLGALFALIKYAAALYLIWFGVGLIRGQRAKASPRERAPVPGSRRGGLAASFAAGLLLTLGDIKAIFFYASLLPTFVDLGALSGADTALLAAITVSSVGGVKVAYALAAHRLATAARGFAYLKQVKTLAGAFFVAAGGYLLLKP